MRNKNDILLFTTHYHIKKWLQSVPNISAIFCIRKHSIIDAFFLTLYVLSKPLNGLTYAFAKVALPQNVRDNRRDIQIFSNNYCRMFCS